MVSDYKSEQSINGYNKLDSKLRKDCINYLIKMSRRKFTSSFKLNAIRLGE